MGLLTHPAWLIAQSGNFDNHAIHRGRWIREKLLGESRPLPKTDSPKRVTSRSSWISTSRWATRREIFSRTEFDPMSTAAKVGIQKQFRPCGLPVIVIGFGRNSCRSGSSYCGCRDFILSVRRPFGSSQLARMRAPRKSRHCRHQGIAGAAETSAADVLQHGNQRRIRRATKMFFGSLFQFHRIVPFTRCILGSF